MMISMVTSCSVLRIGKRAKDEEVKDTRTEYEKIVSDQKQDNGHFIDIYEKEGKYYFDITKEYLGRDLLIVNRILQVPAELNEAGINGGMNYENSLMSFELSNDNKHLLILDIKPKPHYPQDAMIGISVEDNYIPSLMGKMKIEGFSNDSTSILVEVTEFYDGSSDTFNNLFAMLNMGSSTNKELSRIVRATAFENNVTVVSDLSTSVREIDVTAYLTVRVASSIVLLPEQPMAARYLSPRVGYFAVPRTFYSDEQLGVETREIITRWRLEPSDREAYKRGELVEPIKPIVFYIDASTPAKWRPFIKKGVEDWNVAFEKAGFRNAIIAKEITSEINRDDLTYSSLTYVASEQKNAMGPSVYDPRSGEIFQADIIWWHNVLTVLKNWVILQTGAQNPDAATLQLPDDIVGDAMRFVACHEVGHSLGLRHNMIASNAYSIDQLRDPEFTSKHGTSPSIMDYARFNYVAQPEDGVTHFSPQIGPYDMLAIQYGYRWYGDVGGESELPHLHQLLSQHTGKLYRYSEAQDPRAAIDPRAQTEDLSDDPVTASTLGIKNLKRLMPQLLEITDNGKPDQDYKEVGILYNALIGHWNTLVYHPLALIGGIEINYVTRDSGGGAYNFVPREQQKRAAEFLIRETIRDVEWLFANDLLKYTFPLKSSPMGYIEQAPTLLLKNAQSYIFWDLLDNSRLIRMSENEYLNGDNAFKPTELTDMLYKAVFSKTERGQRLTVEERFVQKGLVDALIQSVSAEKASKKGSSLHLSDDLIDYERTTASVRNIEFHGSLSDRISDAISVKRELLLRIRTTLERRRNSPTPELRGHYQDMILRIDHALQSE
ncbi:MAG: zinc-dependent metalloprotease [Porphyromonas sp.]|nr:zinc-dependent metalloprotease [Porphyromonas sp.]